MFNRKILVLILISFLLLFSSVDNANAYICWGWEASEAKVAKKDVDALFIGKITNIETKKIDETPNVNKENINIGKYKFYVTFEIDTLWKGDDLDKNGAVVEIDSIYEYEFQLNERYLVYGYKINGNDQISIVGCPRAKIIGKNTVKEISYLGNPIYPIETVVPIDDEIIVIEEKDIKPIKNASDRGDSIDGKNEEIDEESVEEIEMPKEVNKENSDIKVDVDEKIISSEKEDNIDTKEEIISVEMEDSEDNIKNEVNSKTK